MEVWNAQQALFTLASVPLVAYLNVGEVEAARADSPGRRVEISLERSPLPYS
jgi:hypothetical protein